MKRYVSLVLLLGFLTHFPQRLAAIFFSIKPSAGISYGGKIFDQFTTTLDYFNFRPEEKADRSVTVNGSLELVFSLLENFSLSVGGGYISRSLNGTTNVFSFPDTTDPKGDFFSTPQFNFKSFSIFLTARWSFPVSGEANGYVLGGAGYYFTRFNNYDKNIYYSIRQPDFTLYYFPIAFNGRSNSVGYHAGAGIEIEFDRNVFFFIESLYRRVNFKDFEKVFGDAGESPSYTFIRNKLGDAAAESTFLYYQNSGPHPEQGDIAYSINNILLSEFVLQIGMRIGF